MEHTEIIGRLRAVCSALNNIAVTGAANAGNLAGCYTILQEVIAAMEQQPGGDGD